MRIEKDVAPAVEGATLLERKLEDKTAQVGVIGLGYVGLPLALLFARKGFATTGFDVDPAKVEKLERGESYISHIRPAAISEEVEQKHFRATDDFAALEAMDACLVCVPTPLDEHREPDLSYIRNTAEEISAHLRPGQLIVLESTTYPGTTEEVMLPILERSGLRCPVAGPAGRDSGAESEAAASQFLLAFSP